MSGALVLSGAPSAALQASTKSYSDSYLGGQAIDTSALSSISNNQVLGWNSASSKWTPLTVVGAADATALQGINIDAGAPTTAKVLVYDTAVASKWAPATLGAASLASDAVTTVKILDSNVTTAKLASSSVTAAVIGSDAVTTTKILDANVTAAKIATGAITSTQISATGGVPTYSVASKTANATLTVAETVVLADSSGGAITLTLPAVAGVGSGQVYTIKKTDSSAFAVNIAPAAGTIDGAATISLYGQYEAVQLVSNGTNWFRLGATSKIVNVTVYQDSTRVALSDAASIVFETISVTKKSTTSNLLIEGTLAGFGNYSGAMTGAWKYGAGAEVIAQGNMYQNSLQSFSFPTTAWITGHTTTGAQNLVFRFYAVDGTTTNKPFNVYNPNATEDARLAQTKSTFIIWEIEP